MEEIEHQWADRVLECLNNAGGRTEGCSVNQTVVVKNKQKTIHGELSGTLPLEEEQTLLAVSPP